ncbi:hypothetical protein RMI87_15305 [Pseudomonas aeruginosa]|uniref:hypothetical protein n=1 Tax=Pseudomonas aeruginosa TaxID=287 RepID=UPI00287D7AEE|nr:hypothetical protein [Pseudomonas aeruginosa]MDS9914869.1 hypothetical protein [Pseudomonas aeruginosa]
MSEQAIDLIALSKAVPTLDLKVKIEDEGKKFLMAGEEPIFRCRSNELGDAYGLLVIGALALLPQALNAQHPSQDAGLPLSLDEPLKAEITSRVVQALSLQPDLRQKAELAGKLVYAAIEPYVRGPAADEGFSITEPARSQAPAVDVIGLRRDAVQDFASWLAEEGRLSKLQNEQDLADLCDEWDESKNA